MSSTALAALTIGLGLAISSASGNEQSRSPPKCARQDNGAIIKIVNGMLDSLASGDEAAVQASLAPTFHAFDGGQQFDGPGLLKAVSTLQRAGVRFKWSIRNPDVTIACDTAWITYRNVGSVTKNGKTESVTWLESAILQYRYERWEIIFFHSSRAKAD